MPSIDPAPAPGNRNHPSLDQGLEQTSDQALVIWQLTQAYQAKQPILRGINLSLPKGQVAMVVGASGAGKSTLLRCINGLTQPTAGSIHVQGHRIDGLKGKALRRMRRDIGMIFQDHALVERLTVMENVLSGRLGHMTGLKGLYKSWRRQFPAQDIQRAYELLDRVGLKDFVDRRADALSGGQKQRVGIARALLQSEHLVLVDEPTASLDPQTAQDVMALIVELARDAGLTALINTHDVALAKQFGDRIVGMRQGIVAFDGHPKAFDAAAAQKIYTRTAAHGTGTNNASQDMADNAPAWAALSPST